MLLKGCIFAELFSGRALFPGKNHNDQLWLVMKGVGRLTDHQMRLLRKDPQLNSFRQPLPHEIVPIESRWGGPLKIEIETQISSNAPQMRAGNSAIHPSNCISMWSCIGILTCLQSP